MTHPAEPRVLPSSRPASHPWLPTSTETWSPLPIPRPPELPEPLEPARGRVVRVGRAWAAAVPDEVPDAARWTEWLALALGEVLIGRRPASRLVGWVGDDVLASLRRRQRLRPAGASTPRTVLRGGRVQHPADGVVEASAVLRSGPRLLVLALRLEVVEGRWVCTALEAAFTPAGASRRSHERPAGAAPAPAAGTR